MALTIDTGLLWRLGYRNLTRQQAADALHEIYEALQLGVGSRIARQMPEAQLSKFEQIVAGGSDERAIAWLEENFPSYKQAVEDEYDRLQRRLEGAIRLLRSQDKQVGDQESLINS